MQPKITRAVHTIDASGQVLGRLATRVATLLMGKHKPAYAPHMDGGDSIVITNASKIVVTGKKEEKKVYKHYTGYQGGLKVTPYRRLKEKKPTEIVRKAVLNMLPHNRLRAPRMKRLKISA